MKFTLDYSPVLAVWELTMEGHEDSIVDLLQTYAGGDHEAALDLFELSSRTGDPDRVRMSIQFAREVRNEQAAARALLELLTATPGFSHG